MESEKIKEIKKALECCATQITCKGCPEYNNEPVIDWFECKKTLAQKTITLINELEREKKEHGKKKFLRGWKLGIEEIAARLKEKLKARHETNRLLLMPVRDVVLSTIEGLLEDVDKTLKELINE